MDLEKNILNLIEESHRLYRQKKIEQSLNQLLQAWEILPEPREKSILSNVIAKELSEVYLEDFKDFQNSERWAKNLISTYENKMDSGDGEFTLGKVYFEQGELDKAKEQFSIAMKKSEGRAFQGEPQKYIDLLKK